MSWLGAGIGAGIGLMFGGPIGAALGAWIGSSFGSGLQRAAGAAVAGLNREGAQTVFIVTVFSMLAKMAKADGLVSKAEVNLIEDFMQNNLRLSAEDRAQAIKIFQNAKTDAYSIYDYARQYRQLVRNEAMREMVYRLLFAVACADGELHAAEEEILRRIPEDLGLHSSIFSAMQGEFGHRASVSAQSLKQHYDVLGCTPDVSDRELKLAYRRKAAEFHPDKLAAKGLPEEFMRHAEDQMKSITLAYETIVEARKRKAGASA
ncbi:co-chaperone DjlA [Microbulbifer thermotolerans]|uniref:Co-chaperone DjlA n=1 Tax=Microbulbifer thermotolerans TaxID=252514 RepID=A0A143HM93_MICTH|nr:co-chaperone DjlA [Microbulbifer thermotolerans]AMX02819.1 molecular chaperone DjlA [Microbulbifer thermotolerans]MCX2779683.1 co-chaperone DjlA [Microbulbifer thermotolerans]MCX2782650.1 co-chaperone DjlA [Microbulbifer thermotolerans]MCX2794662.1 co-chaperone DjlA [Microbulbifer thermotolerans]MCX2801490.1 co-chaperone DjlA [Microbulbifer thermotolerans]